MALVATLDGTDDYQSADEAVVETTQDEKGEPLKQASASGEKQSTVDSLARELGWTPKDDFKGNPDDYVDAATYIRRSKEIAEAKNNQIGSLKKQLKEISSVVNELKTHNERIYKTEVKRLESELESLKSERKVAITDGDVDKVEEIEKKITELHSDAADSLKAAKSTTEAPAAEPNKEWISWKKENAWYGSDDELTDFADKFAAKHEGAPFKRVLELVREEAELMFPEKFPKAEKEKMRTPASSVESGTRRSSPKSRFTESDLTPAQRAIMGKFVRQGVMTKEAYIKDLATMGELS